MSEIQYLKPRPSAPLKFTDGGRLEAGLTNERKDCTVRAAAIALEIPYREAHLAFALLGRKCGRGFSFSRFASSNMRLHKILDHKRCRVSTVLKRLAKGRYVCRIRGHVFAVVDGVMHDKLNDFNLVKNCLVSHVWQALPLATPVTQPVKLLPCTVPAV